MCEKVRWFALLYCIFIHSYQHSWQRDIATRRRVNENLAVSNCVSAWTHDDKQNSCQDRRCVSLVASDGQLTAYCKWQQFVSSRCQDRASQEGRDTSTHLTDRTTKSTSCLIHGPKFPLLAQSQALSVARYEQRQPQLIVVAYQNGPTVFRFDASAETECPWSLKLGQNFRTIVWELSSDQCVMVPGT